MTAASTFVDRLFGELIECWVVTPTLSELPWLLLVVFLGSNRVTLFL